MVSVPDFCPEQWVWLWVTIVVIAGSWLRHISTSNSVIGVTNYYHGYEVYYNKFRKTAFLSLHPTVFSIVWPLLLSMMVAAVYVFLYYDDICYATSNNRFHGELTPADDDDPEATLPYEQVYTRGIETATMILITLLALLLALWNTAAALAYADVTTRKEDRDSNLYRLRDGLKNAVTWTTVLTFFTGFTTIALCVLTSIVAHAHPSHNLIFVPVTFGIATLWLALAFGVSYHFSHNIDELKLN